ncbi:MAG TPA: hypothetical protein VFH68_11565, partial [Polyangia bacterium]|nr:hypothetical protein [Polyangia bacterium]
PALASGTLCTENGGKLCNGTSTCVQCRDVGDCDASQDTVCNKIRCGSSACVYMPELVDTVVPDTVTGDCRRNVCDGSGGVSSIADDSDQPPNGNECATAGCLGGTVSVVNKPPGTSCSQNSGTACDGAGNCI